MRTNSPTVVYTAPIVEMVEETRSRAKVLRASHVTMQASLLENLADRIDAALERAQHCEYVDTATAAELWGISEEAVRARCRRKLYKRGLARKRGGTGPWEIHISALGVSPVGRDE